MYVRSFNRFELKYVLELGACREFQTELAPYTRRDAHAGERGYRVHSVYWDSEDLGFLWEKVDGQKYRRKLRMRRYDDAADGFIEIKQRMNRTVQKRRLRASRERVAELFPTDGFPDPSVEIERDAVLHEALSLRRRYDLRPILAVSYRRLPLVAEYENDLRITFDTGLSYDPQALDLEARFQGGRQLLDPRFVLMEIKFNDRVPLWLTKLVSRHGLELIRYSKYCGAVDLCYFDGRYT